MITDARALKPDYIPQDMAHRDGPIDHMATALDLRFDGENITIFGPSGSGKTTLAKYVLDRLESDALEFRWGYCSCISESTKHGVLHQLVRDAGLGRDMQRTGTATGQFLDRLESVDDRLALVVDEVDLLDEPELMSALAELRGVWLVAICIDQDRLHTDLREHEPVRSRLRAAETITLDRYSHDQMLDILEYRVEHGLDASRVTDAAVADIADRAAGNAREGISYLRAAARHVYAGNAEELTLDVVEDIAGDAREDTRQRGVRYLGTHKRALYEIIREAGPDSIRPEQLYERYEQRVQNPRDPRQQRRYLDSLQRYDLIENPGKKSGSRYQIKTTE